MYVALNYGADQALQKYDEILNCVKENIEKNISLRDVKDTNVLKKELSELHTEEELKAFIQANSAAFSVAYRKLHAYIMVLVEKKSKLKSSSINNLANGQGWSSSLKQSVSAIRTGKWNPTRDKIISLGLHLCLTREEVDEMLTLAGMSPLYVKNIFENILIYILTNAELNDYYVQDSSDYDMDNLCHFAKQVFDELDLPELDFFMPELPSEEDEWALER
jgi:hypothetical protein